MSSTKHVMASEAKQSASVKTEIASGAVRPRNDTYNFPPQRDIRRVFDTIAFRYDFLNSLLSLTLDDSWRRRARDLVLEGKERSILDLGVGTGRFLKCFLAAQKWDQAVGLDFSSGMLQRARGKLPSQAGLVSADFHDLPFREGSFDLVISAFTLRSVEDMPRFLSGVYRLLSEKGKAAFLCLTRPRSRLWQWVYSPYLRFYVPCVGRLVSGHREAYQFLSQSVQTFQEPSLTAAMMRQAGFASVSIHPFTLGSATLLVGRKK